MLSFSMGHHLSSVVTPQPRGIRPSYQWTMVLDLCRHNLHLERNWIKKVKVGVINSYSKHIDFRLYVCDRTCLLCLPRVG